MWCVIIMLKNVNVTTTFGFYLACFFSVTPGLTENKNSGSSRAVVFSIIITRVLYLELVYEMYIQHSIYSNKPCHAYIFSCTEQWVCKEERRRFCSWRFCRNIGEQSKCAYSLNVRIQYLTTLQFTSMSDISICYVGCHVQNSGPLFSWGCINLVDYFYLLSGKCWRLFVVDLK